MLRGVRAFLLAVLAVFVCGSGPAWATAASAAEPGVVIDEGSPAAKEYALALTKARRTGTSAHTGSHEAPFGAGITPPRTGGKPGGSGGSHPPRRGATASGGAGASQASGPAATLPAQILHATRPGSSSGNGSALALLGGGVAILVLGGLGGLIFRHSRRPTSPA
jgi:hypothetical protein